MSVKTDSLRIGFVAVTLTRIGAATGAIGACRFQTPAKQVMEL